jgi:4-aminobutyrate aminotransferase-like enzyme/Ser/Thr protein kinase RdoA (MazF antagonist)
LSEALYDKISLGAPMVAEAEIRALLLADYGLTVERSANLDGEIDQNARIDCTDGHSYVVKVSGDLTDPASLAWQMAILHHLERVAPDIPVPRVVKTNQGADGAILQREQRRNAVRVLTWVPGRMIGDLSRKSPELLFGVGEVAGQLSNALGSMPLDGATTAHHWDLTRAQESVDSCLEFVTDPERHALIERTMRRYRDLGSRLNDLPTSVAHQDLNDFNVLVSPDEHHRFHVTGIIDVGDALHTIRISELAVAVAYAMLATPDPLRAAADVVRGFASMSPLSDAEIEALFPLATARLCMNAATWTRRVALSDVGYGAARMRHTWPLLSTLDGVPTVVAEAAFRAASGREPWPGGSATRTALETNVDRAVVPGATPLTRHLEPAPDHAPVRATTDSAQPATLQLGVSIAGEPDPRTPVSGTVAQVDPASSRVVLRHDVGATRFWSQWSGVNSSLNVGDALAAGQSIGVAQQAELHVALVSAEDLFADVLPHNIQPWLREVWADLSPDPTVFLTGRAQSHHHDPRDAVSLRNTYLGHAQRFYYHDPMSLVSSDGVWLHDVDGLKYLDAINNVTHVGHAEPTVADAVSRQVRRLNTNSRFVYAELAEYAERLVAQLPDPLAVVYFVCTGSEANDLALRIARQVTARHDVMVVDGAYHGNTTAVIEISPDRYDGPGGAGRPATTHPVLQPNRYRGDYGYDDDAAGPKYAANVAAVAEQLTAMSRPPAAFFCESLIGSAGQITLPEHYLRDAFAAVRRAGGLCVSDEVQVGLGRLGRFCGFELQDVVPDIVTFGKPMGNGMPLAAVVTTADIAAEFDRGMKYFNTFAGNPVSCAAGMAVLDVLERDGLQERARSVGAYLLDRLRELQSRHALIGDVRGQGFYLGIELVQDPETKQPAGPEADYISERMRQEGVAIYPNGRNGNILKMKPPMIFNTDHADLLAETLDRVMSSQW